MKRELDSLREQVWHLLDNRRNLTYGEIMAMSPSERVWFVERLNTQIKAENEAHRKAAEHAKAASSRSRFAPRRR